MPNNLIVDGDGGGFNDSVDPGGNPPSDWGITKQVYSGGTPSNQGGSFTRGTTIPDPFEGTAYAVSNFSGGSLPAGLINAWKMDTAITVLENTKYIVQGYFAFGGGASNYDNIKPFVFPEGFDLADLQIESVTVGSVVTNTWTYFSIVFNSGSNTSVNMMMGGENLVASGGGGNAVFWDKLEMFELVDLTQEKKKVCILQPCSNPFFVKWLNSLGGWGYWMFEYNQEVQIVTQKEDEVGTRVLDLEESEQWIRSLGSSQSEEFRVRATNLTDDQFDALSEIGGSKQVYRMFQDKSQVGLIVKRMVAVKSKKEKQHVIDFTFKIPEKVFQTE